jgi:hypothetical protein
MDLNIDLTIVTLFRTMLVTARSQFRAVRILSNSPLPLSAGRFRLDERRVLSRRLPIQSLRSGYKVNLPALARF